MKKRKAKKERIYQSEDEEAEKTQQTWSIKKRSMLPKGDSANTSKITYCRICMNTKFVFVLEYEEDDDDDSMT